MKNKILVIYSSKTGFTERYARWLAEETGCDVVPYRERESASPASYDAVVYGGWFHAGSIVGAKWFREKLPSLSGKTTALFAVGASPADVPEVEEAIARCFTEQERRKTPVFYLPGGLNYEKMGKGSRLLMALFRKMMKKEKGEDSEMYQMLCRSYDISSRAALAPLVRYLKEQV